LQRKKDHTRAFEEVVAYAKDTKPDLFLVSGDLFDQIRPGNWVRAVLMQNFKTLYSSRIRVFMISGDHDTPKSIEEGVSPSSVYESSGYAVYFENPADPKPRSIIVDGKQVNVFGLGLNPFLSSGDDPLAKVSIKKTEGVNILLAHYPIEGFKGYIGEEPSIRLASIPHWFSLISAGHFHNHQLEKIEHTTIVFPGSTERASFAEENEDKGFVWAEIKDDGEVTTEFIKTHPRPFKTVELEFPEEGNANSLIEQQISRLSDQEIVLRIKLKGRITVDRLASYRRPDVLSFAQGKFFFCRIEEDFEVQAPEPIEALSRTTPLAEIRHYIESLIASSEESDKKKILLEALQLSESKLQEAGAW
jgi:DNA repair protein SbcD/Mre11